MVWLTSHGALPSGTPWAWGTSDEVHWSRDISCPHWKFRSLESQVTRFLHHAVPYKGQRAVLRANGDLNYRLVVMDLQEDLLHLNVGTNTFTKFSILLFVTILRGYCNAVVSLVAKLGKSKPSDIASWRGKFVPLNKWQFGTEVTYP